MELAPLELAPLEAQRQAQPLKLLLQLLLLQFPSIGAPHKQGQPLRAGGLPLERPTGPGLLRHSHEA